MGVQHDPHYLSKGEPRISDWGLDSDNKWVTFACYGPQALGFCKFVCELGGGEGGFVKLSECQALRYMTGPSL